MKNTCKIYKKIYEKAKNQRESKYFIFKSGKRGGKVKERQRDEKNNWLSYKGFAHLIFADAFKYMRMLQQVQESYVNICPINTWDTILTK